MRTKFIAAFLLAFISSQALAQNPGIIANGVIVPGHGVKWLDRLHVQDSGSALPSTFVSSFNARTGAVVPATNDYSFAQLSSSIACAQYAALTGDITTPAGSCATTLATVNGNVGTFGSPTLCTTVTANAKGLITAISAATCTPAFSSITGTIATGQVSGSYTGITGVGTLTVGSIGAGFVTTGITSVGTLTAGALGAGFTTVAVAQGGTGDTGTAWSAFTPTFTCGTATFSTFAAVSKTIGKTTFFNFDFAITILGTCTNTITFSLPLTANSSGYVTGGEIVGNSLQIGCSIVAAGTTASCTKHPIANFAAGERYLGSAVFQNQ